MTHAIITVESLLEKTSKPLTHPSRRKKSPPKQKAPIKQGSPSSGSEVEEPRLDPYPTMADHTPLTKRSKVTRRAREEKEASLSQHDSIQVQESLIMTDDEGEPPTKTLSRSGDSKAYDLLLAKYEELRRMRLTDAESQFQAYRKSVEERFAGKHAFPPLPSHGHQASFTLTLTHTVQ